MPLTDKERARFEEILTGIANGHMLTRAESKEGQELLAKLSAPEKTRRTCRLCKEVEGQTGRCCTDSKKVWCDDHEWIEERVNNMREKILKLFEVSHSNEIYMSFVDLMCEEMKAQSDDPALADKAVAAIKTVIATEMPALNEQFIQLYADTYNEEEIDAMIAYHNSPIGKKVEAMRKHLTAEGARISQGLQPKIMAAIQQVALDNLLGQ